jgi:hypothetical protein
VRLKQMRNGAPRAIESARDPAAARSARTVDQRGVNARVARAERLASKEELLVCGRLDHLRIEILELLWAEEREAACTHIQQNQDEVAARDAPMAFGS